MVRLCFFCELEAGALAELFADGTVIRDLLALRAGVSLGLVDLSPERAAVVVKLQQVGVPLIAWLLLDQADGYFAHAGNAAAVSARYEAFRRWSAEHGLRWEGVGLDLEPARHELELYDRSPWRGLLRWIRNAFDESRLGDSESAYAGLADRIRAHGLRLEVYRFPLMLDERRAGSRLLRRGAGVADVAADREVLLVYSTLSVPRGPALLCSYAREARAIAVGSTGGGIDHAPKLTEAAFRRDLGIAAAAAEDVYVFSLEGCVRRGMLTGLARDGVPGPPGRAAVAFWQAAGGALRLCLRAFLRTAAAAERLFGRMKNEG